jgi:membrane protein
VISAAISAFGEMLNKFWPGPPIIQYILQVVNFAVSFGVVTVLFALIFKILPDAKIAWRDVWLGAAVSALLFTIGKFLIGLYLGKASVGSAYGAAGSLVVFIVWVYYSAQIFFLGAQFTQVFSERHGSRAERRARREARREQRLQQRYGHPRPA